MRMRLELRAITRVYALVIAAYLWLVGILMLTLEEGFRTHTLQVAYDTLGPRWWGTLFSTSAGLFVLFRNHRSAAAPMSFVSTAWAAMLAWTALTDSAASPTAWVWPACVASLLTLGIARGDL